MVAILTLDGNTNGGGKKKNTFPQPSRRKLLRSEAASQQVGADPAASVLVLEVLPAQSLKRFEVLLVR